MSNFKSHIAEVEVANECEWSDFGAWSPCSVTCGNGVQQQEKHLIFAKKNADSSLSSLCGEEEQTIQTRSCQLLPCRGKTSPENLADFGQRQNLICVSK